MAKSPAWQRKEGKNPEGGLNKKGVASYRAANPGSKLKTAVTTKPSKLKKGSKSANRRKSFCARMGGMKKRLTSAKTANDPNSRINKSLRKWNCEDGGYIETKNTGGAIMPKGPGTYGSKVGRPKKKNTATMAGGGKIKRSSLIGNPHGTYMDKGGKVKTREEKYAEAYGDTKNFKGKGKKVYSPLKGKRKEGKKMSGSPYNIKKLKPGDKGYKSAEQLNKEVRAFDARKKDKGPGKSIRKKRTTKTMEERMQDLTSPMKAISVKKDKKTSKTKMTKAKVKTMKAMPKKAMPKKETKMSKAKSKAKKVLSMFKPISVKEKAARKKKSAFKKESKFTTDTYSPVVSRNPETKVVNRQKKVVTTKSGDQFPVMKKKSTSAQSFREAFAKAKAEGLKTFPWQGRKYSTKVKGEKKDGGKVKKYNMGGMVDVPQSQAFKQGIKYFEGGGRVSVSNDNAGAGDVAHVHSHSGYKAGE
jgi:hypothetical protein